MEDKEIYRMFWGLINRGEWAGFSWTPDGNSMTFFNHRITNAVSEALNSTIQTIKKKACGFRNREHFRIAVYFHCGGLNLLPLTNKNIG